MPIQEPLDEGRYDYPIQFDKRKHIGEWKLRIEMADDPNQYELSYGIEVSIGDVEHWTLGMPILPPDGTDKSQEPLLDEDVKDSFLWYNNKLYPMVPFLGDGRTQLTTKSDGTC